jgi:hypothetical protein
MAEVVVLDEFAEWYGGLNDQDTDAVARIVGLLEHKGVALGSPYSSQIKGSNMAMRELRVQSGGDPIRILYAFDPKRQAVLLLGGNKGGDDGWYETNVPLAEKRYRRYLAGG